MTASETDLESDTRKRLIDASTEMFVEHGFGAAKVRDIAERANANIAAVNYYFGSKEGLYAAVIQHHAAQAIENISQHRQRQSKSAVQASLRNYVSNFLKRLLVNTPQFTMGKIIAREMIEPTAAFELIVEKYVRPQFVGLNVLIRSLVGNEVPDETIRRCSLSVVGQCLYYQCARRVVGLIDPDFGYQAQDIERLAGHIVEFSLGGIGRIAHQRRQGRRRTTAKGKKKN